MILTKNSKKDFANFRIDKVTLYCCLLVILIFLSSCRQNQIVPAERKVFQPTRIDIEEAQNKVDQAVVKEVGAARFLNLQVKTLRNWRSKKIGPDYIRYGRAIRYRIGDLERFLEERVVRTKS